MKVIAVIPARYQSQRLNGKLLKDINGISLLQRVYQQVSKVNAFEEIIVATDHEKIFNHCQDHRMNVVMTAESHKSGTDRMAEVAQKIEGDVFINIQGDEPFIEPECIEKLIEIMQHPEVQIGSLTKKIKTKEDLFDYNTVKVVMNFVNDALYFSRSPIPAQRDFGFDKWLDKETYYQHLGLYAFTKETLLKVTKLEMSRLESTEKLEQLRWLENGYSIKMGVVESKSFGVDTPADLEKARNLAILNEQ